MNSAPELVHAIGVIEVYCLTEMTFTIDPSHYFNDSDGD